MIAYSFFESPLQVAIAKTRGILRTRRTKKLAKPRESSIEIVNVLIPNSISFSNLIRLLNRCGLDNTNLPFL
ncbi:hypothetical protein LEP1GSC169_0377 [Leptospira santarosai str. HAI1349]|nr:hypothetical protein LEP1GSC169_0377 [Leptospira santarosai str. HAI1349]